ncbi:MAG: ribonuclease HII [Nanoarchaeota archaeon]|nr:ribonuclease HII [Nanoarchaeota archaeon]MBU1005281.1 ribonuclease HII [Nanoarchaeota archaeon]MBU1947060.1 ribonuclease HII [Nanoarchaeota archaeon]
MSLVCGIDEAGRGPVIGPMVMAGVLVDDKDIPKLKSLGVKDSKLLTPKQREDLFPKIIKLVKSYKIIIIPPKEIDDVLESEDLNLNWLEAIKSAEIINSLKPNKSIVDCPSSNIQAYKSYLLNLLKIKTELVVEHKADVNYPEASAASILAKVTRDREMEKIQKKYGNCGPGYPANETTQKFLKENWEKHPEIFRQSWISYKNHKNSKFQKTMEDFGTFLKK